MVSKDNEIVGRLLAYGRGVKDGSGGDTICKDMDKRELLKYTVLMQGNKSIQVLRFLNGRMEASELRFWETQEERLREISKLSDEDIRRAFNTRSALKLGEWLRTLPGIGIKKSNMLLNILYRDCGVKFKDLHKINVTTDVHVLRVSERLGLSDGTVKGAISMARWYYPAYPGILDLPLLYLGMNICRKKPKCSVCFLCYLCPSTYEIPKVRVKG